MIYCQPDWSNMSSQVLSSVFEAQRNALDNCAAACVWASWRAAVQDSHISTLHLHALTSFDYEHWQTFLQARPSVCHLKLTSSFWKGATADDYRPQSSEANGQSCFSALPLVCDSLFLGYPFSCMQPHNIYKVVGLKDLTIQAVYDCDDDDAISSRPQLQQLTQLTSLTIEVDRFLHDYRATIMHSLYTSPESLRSFSLHLVDQNLDEMLPFSSNQLSYCIKHIVALALKDCCVVFVKGDVDVSSLHGLQALSLHGSRVYGNHLGINTLTDLTSLT